MGTAKKKITLNLKLSKFILLILLIPFIGCSQNKNSTISSTSQNVSGLDGLYINKEINISADKRLEDGNGIIIGGDGKFNVQKGATLTIASKITPLQSKQLFYGDGQVLFETGSVDYINVIWFGATPDDGASDATSVQRAINAAIYSTGVSVVYFPPGVYDIEKPLLALRDVNNKGEYDLFNLTLRGHQLAYNNPGDGKSGVSVLKANKEIPFVFGMQGARGVEIENMVFDGYINSKFEIADLISKSPDELYKQDRYTPLCAIVIDPFSSSVPKSGGYNGLSQYYNNKRSSSNVMIRGSVFQNFPSGLAISPNGETQQGDTVAINFCRFYNLVNGVIISQTQSRNIVVDNCTFGRNKFAFNSEDFGEMNGVLPEVNNCKIADGVAWLFKANGNVAYGHFRNIYAEALYGLGYSKINKQPLNFEGCVFRFRPQTDDLKGGSNPCLLKADNASFTGCTFTMGGGKNNVEPIVMDVEKATFINCYLDSYPVNIGKSLKKQNETTYINSNQRPNKKETTSWKSTGFSAEESIKVSYNRSRDLFSFNGSGFKEGDFIFGKYAVNEAPFNGESIYTALGEVEQVSGNTVFFKSSLLPKSDATLQITK